MKQVVALVSKLQENLSVELKAVLSQVQAEVMVDGYDRARDLQKAMYVSYEDQQEPNKLNPNTGDILRTVHILARLQGELVGENLNTSTGLFEYAFGRRIALLRAWCHETETLATQHRAYMDAAGRQGQATISAPAVDPRGQPMLQARGE